MFLVYCIIPLFRDRISNVELNVVEQSTVNDAESSPSQQLQMSSQPLLIEPKSIASVQPVSVKQETPRLPKKRKNESAMDDELAAAIIQSLGNAQTLTPLGQSVSNLEAELKQLNQKRLLLELSREINKVVNEIQEKSLSLLDEN